MVYMLWMMKMENPICENIRQALEHHEKKYGKAPNIVEYSNQLQAPDVEKVTLKPIQIPKNILLVGVQE